MNAPWSHAQRRGGSRSEPVSACPICGQPASLRRLGQVTLYVCTWCGHGHSHQSQENSVFEGAAYAEWRTENERRLTISARKKVDTLVRVTGRAPSMALEYGCATGEVLAELEQLGTRCFGLDLSEPTLRTARLRHPNMSVILGDEPPPEFSFDAVLAFHVLEHISDPGAFMNRAYCALAPGGFLYLRVPNWASLSSFVWGQHWPDIMREHLHYFTLRSMRILLCSRGLDVAYMGTEGHAWHWLGGLRRLAHGRGSSGARGRPPGRATMNILTVASDLMRPMLLLERCVGRGSELVAIARRQG